MAAIVTRLRAGHRGSFPGSDNDSVTSATLSYRLSPTSLRIDYILEMLSSGRKRPCVMLNIQCHLLPKLSLSGVITVL